MFFNEKLYNDSDCLNKSERRQAISKFRKSQMYFNVTTQFVTATLKLHQDEIHVSAM